MEHFAIVFFPIFFMFIVIVMIFNICEHFYRKKDIETSINNQFIPIVSESILDDYSDCNIVMPSYSCPVCGAVINESADSCSGCGHKRPSSMVKYQKIFANADTNFSIFPHVYRERNENMMNAVNLWLSSHKNLTNVNIKFDYKVARIHERVLNQVIVTFNQAKEDNNILYCITPLYFGTYRFREITSNNVLDSWKANNPNCIVVSTTGGVTTHYNNNTQSGIDGTTFIAFKTNRP